MIYMKRLFQVCFMASLAVSLANGQQQDNNSWYETPVALIEDIYRSVSKTDSGTVDWERVKSMVYKDIAFIATVYSAAIIGREAPQTRGVDLWLLNKKDGFWKITSVINEVIPPGEELPDDPEWRINSR